MGAWGYGILQSDQELDIMADISDQAGKLTKIRNFSFWYPKDQDEAVRRLNAGAFHQLLQKFQTKKWKHGIIYLGALSMRIGVTISQPDMHVIRDSLKRVKMYDEARGQMEEALKGYKNGESWNFAGLGLVEDMRHGTNPYANSHAYLANVRQDWSKMPKYMPRDGQVASDDSESEVETKSEKNFKVEEPTTKDKLVTTLKALRYGS